MPTERHTGMPFSTKRDSVRRAKANNYIAGGLLGALFEYRGDLKQFAEGLGLPHYHAKTCSCIYCKCTKADANSDPDYGQQERTHDEYVQACFQQKVRVAVTPQQVQQLKRVLRPSKTHLGVAIGRGKCPALAELGLRIGDRLLPDGDLVRGWTGGDIAVMQPANRLAVLHFFPGW